MKLCVTNESYIKYTYMISQKHNHMMLWTMQALLRRVQPHQRDCGGKESRISNQNQSRIHSKCMEPRHVSTSTHAHDGNVQHQNIPPPSLSLSLSYSQIPKFPLRPSLHHSPDGSMTLQLRTQQQHNTNKTTPLFSC